MVSGNVRAEPNQKVLRGSSASCHFIEAFSRLFYYPLTQRPMGGGCLKVGRATG